MNAAHPTAPLREQLYRDMAPLNLTPLWEVLHALVPQQPASPASPRCGNTKRCGPSSCAPVKPSPPRKRCGAC